MPSLPLFTSIPDPSGIESMFNQLVNNINTGVGGLQSAATAAVATAGGTSEQTLQTLTLPANFFTKAGQTVRLVASGTTAANGNNKTIKVEFGTIVISSGVIAINAKKWKSVLEVMHTGANTQTWNGLYTDTTTGNIVDGGTAAVTESAQISCTVKCTDGTDSAGDITCNNFYIEIIK